MFGLPNLEVMKIYNVTPIVIKPQIETLPSTYQFIRFWGRIPNYMLDDLFILGKNKKILLDPFGGSGSVILKGLNYQNFEKLIYNDINPAFVFITKTFYNSLKLETSFFESAFKNFREKLLSNPLIIKLSRITLRRRPFFIYKIGYDNKLSILNEEINLKKLDLKNKKLKKLAYEILERLHKQKHMMFSKLRSELLKQARKDKYDNIRRRIFFSVVLKKLIQLGIIKKETIPVSMILSSSITYPKNSKEVKMTENLTKMFSSKESKYESLIEKKVFSYKLVYPNGNSFMKAEGAKEIGDLYTSWSKILLSIIWKQIIATKVNEIKDVLKLCLFASLYDSSTMQMFHKSGWIIKSFWVPPFFGVKNPIHIFLKKMNYFLSLHRKLKENINLNPKVSIYCKDIFDLSEEIIKEKPDFVLTHPPYFSTVQYGELSTIWLSWLGYKMPFDKEIIENIRQGKDKNTYLQLMEKSLNKISELATKNSTIILIFQSKDKNDWKLLDNVLVKSPLELTEVRCYKRIGKWSSPLRIFNIGKYDYAFIFKNV